MKRYRKAPSPEGRSVGSWIKLRFGLEPILKHFVYHRVTKRVPWLFGEGSALLLLLITLVVTGAFLGLGYSPATDAARESVIAITERQYLGWFIRGLHYWSAGMMMVLVLYHLLRHLLFAGYQPPREGIWLIGTVLLVLTVINAFTGYTLRWDESGVYAVRLALTMFSYVPVIGDDLVRIIQGGSQLSDLTLRRLFAVHVLFVPLSLLFLTAYHVYLVVIHGVTTYEERREVTVETAEEQIALRQELVEDRRTGVDFFPYQVAKTGSFALFVFLVVLSLTLFVGPPPLEGRADFSTPAVPEEEWWFHWYSALIAYLPPRLAPTVYILLPLTVVLLLIALPFLDHGANRGIQRRPLAVVSVTFILIVLFAFTGLRLRSPWMSWPSAELTELPAGSELTPAAAEGRILFAEYGCNSCHTLGGRGSGVGPNLSGLDHRLSPAELRRLILRPPAHWAMPPYEGRIDETQLDRLVQFVLVAQTFPKEY